MRLQLNLGSCSLSLLFSECLIWHHCFFLLYLYWPLSTHCCKLAQPINNLRDLSAMLNSNLHLVSLKWKSGRLKFLLVISPERVQLWAPRAFLPLLTSALCSTCVLLLLYTPALPAPVHCFYILWRFCAAFHLEGLCTSSSFCLGGICILFSPAMTLSLSFPLSL